MSEKVPSKADALRAMREANYAAKSSPARLDQSGHGPSDESCLHSGVATRHESEKPIKNSGGETLSPRKVAHSELGQAGITASPPEVKLGRPRLGEKRDKPWLHTKPPMSKTTWYRRKAEGTLP